MLLLVAAQSMQAAVWFMCIMKTAAVVLTFDLAPLPAMQAQALHKLVVLLICPLFPRFLQVVRLALLD